MLNSLSDYLVQVYIHLKRTLSITIAELCLQYKYYVLLELEGVTRHVPINMDKF